MKLTISSHIKQIVILNNKHVCATTEARTLALQITKCLTSQLIYQADGTNNLDDEYKYYLGPEETIFKERQSNHKTLFKNENNESSTELLKYGWSLRDIIN